MLQKQIEALLFSAGRKMTVEELAKLTKSKIDKVKQALVDLTDRYDEHSSLMLVNEGDSWKLAVREQHLNLVKNIVTETELSKTVMETLAVIAFKYPIKQSDLIAIRTNKAYDHLKELEGMGYITRQKHGRTNLIKLTQKFFEYFDLREEQLKEKFKDFRSIANAIEGKEKEVEDIKQQQQEQLKEEKSVEQQEASIQEEIESLEEYDTQPITTTPIEEKLGELNVVDEPSDSELEAERERIRAIQDKKDNKSSDESDGDEGESAGIVMDETMEKIVDEKVDSIMNPKENASEDQSEKSPEKETLEDDIEEEKDLLEASMEEEQKSKTDQK